MLSYSVVSLIFGYEHPELGLLSHGISRLGQSRIEISGHKVVRLGLLEGPEDEVFDVGHVNELSRLCRVVAALYNNQTLKLL